MDVFSALGVPTAAASSGAFTQEEATALYQRIQALQSSSAILQQLLVNVRGVLEADDSKSPSDLVEELTRRSSELNTLRKKFKDEFVPLAEHNNTIKAELKEITEAATSCVLELMSLLNLPPPNTDATLPNALRDAVVGWPSPECSKPRLVLTPLPAPLPASVRPWDVASSTGTSPTSCCSVLAQPPSPSAATRR